MENMFLIEGWKDIKGYEGLYQISNLGRIKSKDRKIVHRNGVTTCIKSKILKPSFNQQSTPIYVLSKDGIRRSFSLKRILNDNGLGGFSTFKYKKASGNKNGKLSKKILQLSIDGTVVKEWPSINECGRSGFNTGKIGRCCKETFRTHKNFYWRYA